MDKVLAVARREFIATVKTKAFVLSVVLMPVIMVGAIYGTEWVQRLAIKEQLPLRRLAVIDRSERVLADLEAQFAAYNQERPSQPMELATLPASETDTAALADRVNGDEFYGYLIVSADAVEADGGCVLARKDSHLQTGLRLEEMVKGAIVSARFRQAGIDRAQVETLSAQAIPIEWLDAKTGEPVSSDRAARMLTPYAFMFLLFMGTFVIAQGLLTTVIEEKSSRVVEVLLSAVSPTQLMAGKIVGTAFVGLALIAVWGGAGFASASAYNLGELVSGYRVTISLLYFVPGFLLIAALMAAMGSACNELKEAQSMVFPLSLLTMIPMIFGFYFLEHPASAFSIALSHVPPITPFVMVLRVCADPDTPIWQIVTTLVLLWVSVGVTIWAAGKIFRVGVLMYGKPPSVRELLRWVRYT